jgi:hypothetical protein
MDTIKPWYTSRTVWASLVTVGTSLAGLLGVSTSGIDGSALTDTLLQAVSGVAGIAAIVSRIGATTKLR